MHEALTLTRKRTSALFVSFQKVFLFFLVKLIQSYNYSKDLRKSLLQRCDFLLMENLFIKTFFAGQAKNRTNKPI